MVKDGRLAATVQDSPAAVHFVKRVPGAADRRHRPPAGVLRHLPPQGGRPSSGSSSTRRSRTGSRTAPSSASTASTACGTRTRSGWPTGTPARGRRRSDQEELAAEAGGGERVAARPAVAPGGRDDGLPGGHVVPAGDDRRAAGRPRPGVRPAVAGGPARRVRRGDPRHAAAAPAVRHLLHAPEGWSRSSTLDPFYAGVIGLAINYSAYEAENYRAGLLAIPRGQMEAALSLGHDAG